jgi:hypothetical protein
MCKYGPRQSLGLHDRAQLLADSRSTNNCVCALGLNLSNCTMGLGSNQSQTEMSTRNLLGGKGRSERKADILSAVCEPIASNVEVSSLTTL